MFVEVFNPGKCEEENPEDLTAPFFSFMNVFLMLIVTAKGVSDNVKFKFDVLIWLRMSSHVWFGSMAKLNLN